MKALGLLQTVFIHSSIDMKIEEAYYILSTAVDAGTCLVTLLQDVMGDGQ